MWETFQLVSNVVRAVHPLETCACLWAEVCEFWLVKLVQHRWGRLLNQRRCSAVSPVNFPVSLIIQSLRDVTELKSAAKTVKTFGRRASRTQRAIC